MAFVYRYLVTKVEGGNLVIWYRERFMHRDLVRLSTVLEQDNLWSVRCAGRTKGAS